MVEMPDEQRLAILNSFIHPIEHFTEVTGRGKDLAKAASGGEVRLEAAVRLSGRYTAKEKGRPGERPRSKVVSDQIA